jgi:multiple antibiotic resistance protein
MESLTYFFNTFVGLFVIVDPFAMVPVYLSMTERFSPAEQIATRRKASLLACVILLVFTFSGAQLFHFFGITLGAFQIAGGILLLLLGIAQLNATRSRVRENEEEEIMAKDDVAIFPLAMPLLAGPGAISTAILFAGTAESAFDMLLNASAVVAAIAVSYWVLKMAPLMYRILGQTGLNVLTRVMGIILTAIAVQFILNGMTSSITGMIKEIMEVAVQHWPK